MKTHQPFERPALGARFYLTAQMLKGGIVNSTTQWYKEPLAKPYPLGIYTGYRIVFNGQMETVYDQESWEHPSYEVGRFFVRRESLEVWLFVTNPRYNPIRVFPTDVIPND